MTKFNERKIRQLYQALLERLPSTYPKAELIIHSSVSALRQHYTKTEGRDEGDPPYAYCDADDNTIHVSLAFNEEYRSNMLWYFLHEIGHLFALQKYGWKDPRWDDYKISERYANRFADRWTTKLKKEGWIKT